MLFILYMSYVTCKLFLCMKIKPQGFGGFYSFVRCENYACKVILLSMKIRREKKKSTSIKKFIFIIFSSLRMSE